MITPTTTAPASDVRLGGVDGLVALVLQLADLGLEVGRRDPFGGSLLLLPPGGDADSRHATSTSEAPKSTMTYGRTHDRLPVNMVPVSVCRARRAPMARSTMPRPMSSIDSDPHSEVGAEAPERVLDLLLGVVDREGPQLGRDLRDALVPLG